MGFSLAAESRLLLTEAFLIMENRLWAYRLSGCGTDLVAGRHEGSSDQDELPCLLHLQVDITTEPPGKLLKHIFYEDCFLCGTER